MRNRLVIVLAAIFVLLATCFVPSPRAQWTIMVYLNGDNELEEYIRQDFIDLARVGSTPDVNLVVQYDGHGRGSCGGNPDPEAERWPETLRFHITRGMAPKRRYAYENLCEQNMASGKTLAAFVADAMNAYPARRYALMMVGHGWGPRLLFTSRAKAGAETCHFPFAGYNGEPHPLGVTLEAFRTGSNDDSSPPGQQLLFNRDMADSLDSVLNNHKLDLLVFDECAMGMVETGYAMRKVAKVMVASEELVPGTGMPIVAWLTALVHMPSMGPESLAGLMVRTYQAKYILSGSYTMSAFNLCEIGPLANAISDLAAALKADMHQQWSAVFKARNECLEYGIQSKMHHIDLERFCFRLMLHTRSWRIRLLALNVIDALQRGQIANGPSLGSAYCLGSHGMAIYFPADALTYCYDGLTQCGYEYSNEYFPVAFVRDTAWPAFLHEYYSIVTAANDPQTPPHPDSPTPFIAAACQCNWRCNDRGPLDCYNR